MPFGQMGFMGGQDGGGFFDALPAILQAATPLALGLIRPEAFAPNTLLPSQQFGPAAVMAGAARAGAALGRNLPAILGGAVAGEVVSSVAGGGGGDMTLFRQTATGVARARNHFTTIGPDGKCHTWLHAVPKGWRVNASNVSGRRRHHHHPR